MAGNRTFSSKAGVPALVFAFGLPCAAQINIPDPGSYVVDRAGVVDPPTEMQLEGWLRELEEKTSAQIKVLTVPDTGTEDVFAFAQRHAESWKLGRKGRDNGALVVLVPKTGRRKGDVRIHTGYGLEPVLPDSWVGSLSREVRDAYFRQGQYSDGLQQMSAAICGRVAADAGVTLTGLPATGTRQFGRRIKGQPAGAWCAGVVPLIVFLIVISSLSRRAGNRHRWGGSGLAQNLLWASMLSNMLGGGRRSGWGGGGNSGFGGGFFGGGGRFGGGGGGASW